MLKQLLTGGSVLALLGSLAAQANPKEPRLQSQAPSTSPALMARRLPQHLVVQQLALVLMARPRQEQLLMARLHQKQLLRARLTPGTTPDGMTTPETTPEGTTRPK